ncbi:MAG: hypothetical protein RLZZ292_3119 [Bacteroidota bacterium]|jgi:hypothetical protein
MQENINHFDDTIKSSLEGFQMSYNAAHWEAMDNLLDAAQFDQIVREKLQHTQAPLQMATWEQMASTMDVSVVRKKVIYQSKLVELCLMLLLCSVVPFVALKNSSEEEFKNSNPFQNSNAKEVIAEKENSKSDNSKSDNSKIQKFKNSNTQIFNPANTKNSNTRILKYPNTQILKYSNTQQANNNNNNNNNNTSNLPWHEQPTTTITSFENTETIKTTVTEILKEQEVRPSMQSAPMIAVLSPKLLSEAAKQNVPLFAILKAAKLRQLKSSLRLGGYGSSDKQTIITSDAQTFGKDRDLVQKKHTFSSGITLSIKRNKVEIETGLEYSRLQYAPKAYFTQTATYIRQSLQPIRLELLRIPIGIRYDFHHAERFTTYIATGVALNLATRANYDHSEYGQTIFGRQAVSSNVIKIPSNYPDGLFAGGRFLNNYYLSASLSVGLEYAMSPRYSCYIQPMYSWDMRNKGIGVTQDKIETLSLRVGVKKKIK